MDTNAKAPPQRAFLALTVLFKITRPPPNSGMPAPRTLFALFFSIVLIPSGILHGVLIQVFVVFIPLLECGLRRAGIFACLAHRHVPSIWRSAWHIVTTQEMLKNG